MKDSNQTCRHSAKTWKGKGVSANSAATNVILISPSPFSLNTNSSYCILSSTPHTFIIISVPIKKKNKDTAYQNWYRNILHNLLFVLVKKKSSIVVA